jgi:hypothetical protein
MAASGSMPQSFRVSQLSPVKTPAVRQLMIAEISGEGDTDVTQIEERMLDVARAINALLE